MPTIVLTTLIGAAPERVFDLARSVDTHLRSAAQTKEEVIAGRTSGLLELGETVTWRATHFGIRQSLTVSITAMDRPHSFTDEMVSGAFASFTHLHRFFQTREGTRMVDRFTYRAPLGPLGRIADYLFLRGYMQRFLETRNREIKAIAEAGTTTYEKTSR